MYAFISRANIAGFLATAVAICCGCGQPSTRVYGEITYDNVPIETGGIVFEGIDGAGRSYGATIVDGKYELSGKNAPPPKKFHVTIISAIPTGRKIAAGSPSPPGTMVDELKKIRHRTTQEIIANQENELSFSLKP